MKYYDSCLGQGWKQNIYRYIFLNLIEIYFHIIVQTSTTPALQFGVIPPAGQWGERWYSPCLAAADAMIFVICLVWFEDGPVSSHSQYGR